VEFFMPSIKMTVIRHRGQTVTLGRNTAVKLMLERTAARARNSEVPESGKVVDIAAPPFLRAWSIW
jgi:hypothetical protein